MFLLQHFGGATQLLHPNAKLLERVARQISKSTACGTLRARHDRADFQASKFGGNISQQREALPPEVLGGAGPASHRTRLLSRRADPETPNKDRDEPPIPFKNPQTGLLLRNLN